MTKPNKFIETAKFYLRSREGISPKRRKIGTLLMVVIVTLSLIGGSFAGAITMLNITVTNPSALDVTDQILAIPIASSSFIETGATAADMLNSHLHEGSADIVDMPGTPKINLVAAWSDPTSGGAVDQTTEATDVLTSDMDLPHLQNDEYFFAFHNPSRILHLQLGQKIVGDALVLSWSYCDTSNATTCTSWVAFTDVVDTTSNFTLDGKQTISWTIPKTGAWNKNNHQSTAAYWVRAKVTNNPASVTTVPKGTQSQYETGQWWSYTDSILAGQTLDYQLYVGGIDMKTFHYYFPGFEGVVTGDSADLEPGSDYKFDIKEALKLDTNEVGQIILKVGALDLKYISSATVGGANTITLGVTGAAVNTFFAPFTHNEEDGGSYYSGTSEESYSKSFYKGSSNYITSRQVDDADILSNTSSEVVSHKVGQAYDTSTSTTPAIGAKIDDPS